MSDAAAHAAHSHRPLAALLAVVLILVGLSVRFSVPDVRVGPEPARAAVVSTGAAATIAVVGDFGTADAAEASVASLIAGWVPDAVLGVGDDYYAQAGGSGLGRYDISVGRYYCAFLRGAVAGPNCPSGGTADVNRFWSSTGNHEYSDGGIANYTGYFPFPSNERYYQLRIGPVDVFVLDSDEALRTPADMTAQKAWLAAAAQASTAAWQVVAFHHPPYSSGSTHGSSTAMRWPFASWGIDLVVNGHEHDYERVSADGITYVVDGLGGAGIYGFGTPVAGSQVRYNASHGALRLSVSDTALSGAFVSVDGVTRDTFSMAAPAPTPTPTPTPGPTPTPTPTPTGPGAFNKSSPKNGAKVAAGKVALSWGASANATGYEYCVSPTSGTCATWTATTARKVTVSAPVKGVTWYWEVRAVRGSAYAYANGGTWWRFVTR